MKVETTADIDASAEEIIDFLLKESFYDQLQGELEKVSRVELVDVEELQDGRVQRTARYTAPAQLPRFLRSFKDRAPDEVHWNEIATLDRAKREIRFQIVAEAPEHWHERYQNDGRIVIDEKSGGTSQLTHSLEYSVDVPGLSYIIERSLRSEIKAILNAQDRVLARTFAGRKGQSPSAP